MRDLTARLRFLLQLLSPGVVRFALWAILAAALGFSVPRWAVAQQPVSATQPARPARISMARGGATTAPKAPESEEQEDNVYLHAPVVRSVAKIFHLRVATMARILEGINFLVLVLAIGIPLYRRLPKALRSHAEKVREGIASAREMTEDARQRLLAIETRLSGLDGEIAQMRAQVEKESQQDEIRIKSSLQEESARIVAAASQEIDASATQIRRSLRHFAAELAVAQAAQQIVLTPETDRALIAEFLGGVARDGAPKGEQN
ncbi:MAG: hypothetical protein ACP5FH_03915 [Terracidiphilus sp.]